MEVPLLSFEADKLTAKRKRSTSQSDQELGSHQTETHVQAAFIKRPNDRSNERARKMSVGIRPQDQATATVISKIEPRMLSSQTLLESFTPIFQSTPPNKPAVTLSTPVIIDASPIKQTSALKQKYLAVKEKIHIKEEKIEAESLAELATRSLALFQTAALADIKASIRSDILLPIITQHQKVLSEIESVASSFKSTAKRQSRKSTNDSIESAVAEDEYILSFMLSDKNYDRKSKKRVDYTAQQLNKTLPRIVKQSTLESKPKRKYSMKNRNSVGQIGKTVIVDLCATPPDVEEKDAVRKSKFAAADQKLVDMDEELFPLFDWQTAFEDIGKSAYLRTNKEIRQMKDNAYPPDMQELNLEHSKLIATLSEFSIEEHGFILVALQAEQASRSVKRSLYERKTKLSAHLGKICVAYDFGYNHFSDESPHHAHQRRHITGSSRTEGYYKITDQEKLKYRFKQPAATHIQVIESERAIEASAKSTSRASRVLSRNLTHGMDIQERAFTSAQHPNQDAGLVKISHYKKKALKFGKSAIHDWGLFSMERVDMNDIVIEYIGEKIRQKVADDREKKYEKSGIGSSYLFRVDDDVIIDATKKGGLARFINHCCDKPNCNAKIVTIDGVKRIVIYARRDISIGEEITYDYKFPIETDKITCLCGAARYFELIVNRFVDSERYLNPE